MSAVFVTGAGTGVGKTYVTTLLIRELRARGRAARGLKPVISGYEPAAADTCDGALLLAAAGEPVTPDSIAAISPWRFAAPLAPNMAARLEGRSLDFDDVVDFCRDAIATARGPLLIESVGGAMSPLTDERTVLHWVAALPIPSLVVSGSYLGAVSHALTTLAALRAHGRNPRALIVSESADGVDWDGTLAALRHHAGVPVLAVPRSAEKVGLDQVADLDALFR